MLTKGQSQSVDISTKKHHIWIWHKQACFLCFVIWPTTKKINLKKKTIAWAMSINTFNRLVSSDVVFYKAT